MAIEPVISRTPAGTACDLSRGLRGMSVSSRDHSSTRRRREPKASAAVGAVEQSFRVVVPGGLNLVAWLIGNAPRLACFLVANPQVPRAIFKMAISHPAPIGRQCRVAGFTEC